MDTDKARPRHTQLKACRASSANWGRFLTPTGLFSERVSARPNDMADFVRCKVSFLIRIVTQFGAAIWSPTGASERHAIIVPAALKRRTGASQPLPD